MHVREYALFPTRLLTLQFTNVDELNDHLCDLFASGTEFREGFDMHPDAMNLLSLAERYPAIAGLRNIFREGVTRWLRSEKISGARGVDVVLFSNYAGKGEFTLVHNHNADLVGVYYVRTVPSERPVVELPEPGGEYNYFAAEDGALVLHDPRFNANLAAVGVADYVKVFPRPGLLVVFPGYLWHSVTPHLGDYHRLAFSANFNLRWENSSARAETWTLSVDQ
jgi:hypothetical protein